MRERLKVNIQSEIGRLEGVILHPPGPEVENMTPDTAQRALYSDILNLSIAQKEYEQLYGVLKRYTQVFEIRELLTRVLEKPHARERLLGKICISEGLPHYFDQLVQMETRELAKRLITGIAARKKSLTEFMSDDYYALAPLYNFYFTRDASVSLGNNVVICRMANKVREREALIMEAIFKDSDCFESGIINLNEIHSSQSNICMEGGDLLVAREDIILIGNGVRTSTKAIDELTASLCKRGEPGKKHIIVQELPHSPESFIHLDMVFTLLDRDKCMIFEPVIMNNRYRTVLITIENGKVERICSVKNLPDILAKLGMELETIICGGTEDVWNQEREQWHSGANFFALAPGKVLSYARNVHTLEELSKHGFQQLSAKEVASGSKNIEDYARCVVTIEGSELPRGGGGARCMTMPVRRSAVEWK